jgi:23S rRNA pseudouridine2605 synthase
VKKEMRLNKYIAESGVSSRRRADELIKNGQVRLNGQTVTNLATTVGDQDEVTIDDRVIQPVGRRIVYLLHKPRGVVTTASDPLGRATVLDYVPKSPRVFPCGRLDEDSIGLVVLTNDGDLCYQLTHPKFEHRKEYVVEGTAPNPSQAFRQLGAPLQLKDGPAAADELQLIRSAKNKLSFSIVIHEGRNRLVRRMCAKVGIEIISLTRTKIGQYELGDLPPGKYRVVA